MDIYFHMLACVVPESDTQLLTDERIKITIDRAVKLTEAAFDAYEARWGITY